MLYFNDICALSFLQQDAVVPEAHSMLNYRLVMGDPFFFIEQVESVYV